MSGIKMRSAHISRIALGPLWSWVRLYHIVPAPFPEVNLRTIPHLRETFHTIVGFSDHTLGTEATIAAVTLGAKIIEKHFILDKKLGGPDAAFSLDFQELKQMVKSLRNVERALGEVHYVLSSETEKNKKFMRSLFIVEDIKKGEYIISYFKKR